MSLTESRLTDAHQVDEEDQRLTRSDDTAPGTAVTVGKIGRMISLSPTTDPHTGHTLIPASDNAAGTELELQRLAAVVRGVELLPAAIGHTDVVHPDSTARAGLGTVTDGEIGTSSSVGGGPSGKSTSGFSVITTTYGSVSSVTDSSGSARGSA